MKIPVYMISGFLGSGKTTILLTMIEECKRKGLKAGIILNELGEKNVEEGYFENQNLKQLLNGCICCTMQNDLRQTLRSFVGETIDILFIEGTGVANPADIEETLISPEFIEFFDLHSMISVVDGSCFLEYQNFFASSKEIRMLLHEQITRTTMVVINKIDLTKPAILLKVDKKIKGILNQSVPVFQTNFGKVKMNQLFKKRYFLPDLHAEKTPANLDHKHHQSIIHSIQIKNVPAVNRSFLTQWIEQLPKEVLRGKGIVELTDTPGLFIIQFSSGILRFEKVKKKGMQPVIILIGDGLNEEVINSDFLALLKKDFT
ncbi:hypothetical protein CSV79_14845 [Sporosarcina sp. P13]|uniref:CobW family GTP-binding protein n=1 Tax=Sporosarcina sp. P13 TaxID=2048263 RepID=UPI000C16ADF1|nr:GTP-binding protein [Sporosarcina sp. P13]PIC62866.1 hypothetical protein CSV79_14845 [Sporosarcina sp. P13]